MDENKNEESSINGATPKFKFATPAITKGISGYLKNKSPIKKSKKGKAKILSVVHIGSADDKKNKKANKYVPIILNKSKNSKPNTQTQTSTPGSSQDIIQTQTSTSGSSQDNIVAINPTETMPNQLIQPKTDNNQLPVRKVILVQNSDQFQQVKNYFANSQPNLETHQFNLQSAMGNLTNKSCLQIVNIYDNNEFVNIYDYPITPRTPFTNILNNQNLGNDIALLNSQTAINGIASTSNGYITQLQKVQNPNKYEIQNLIDNPHQLPKFKIKRFVSILKSNQPNINVNEPKTYAGRTSSVATETTVPELETLPLSKATLLELEACFSSLETEIATENLVPEKVPFSITEIQDPPESVTAGTAAKDSPPAEKLNTPESVTAGTAVKDSSPAEKLNTSDVVTVASDDIPYNAEIEIDDGNNSDANKSVDYNALLNLNLLGLDSTDLKDDESQFETLMKNTKRKLFLEKEDPEFCKAARHKIKGIPKYGYRGFNAINKFNYILNLIPDESPATIHALMVACDNEVFPVVEHLRYIKENREIIKKQKYSQSTDDSSVNTPSTSEELKYSKKGKKKWRGDNETPTTSRRSYEMQATEVEEKQTPNTRKKKISYDLDLSDFSDNYEEDSDEDYIPGRDITPQKKKRNKRKHVSKNKIPNIPFPFDGCPVHKTTNFKLSDNNIVNDGEEPSTSQMIFETIPNLSLFPSRETDAENLPETPESDEEKAVLRYPKKKGNSFQKSSTLEKKAAVFKANPVGQEVLELVNYKRKKIPNSFIVPPVQKYVYAHEGTKQFRYLEVSKQLKQK